MLLSRRLKTTSRRISYSKYSSDCRVHYRQDDILASVEKIENHLQKDFIHYMTDLTLYRTDTVQYRTDCTVQNRLYSSVQDDSVEKMDFLQEVQYSSG